MRDFLANSKIIYPKHQVYEWPLFHCYRLEQFHQTHRNCYCLCQAPLHGQTERHSFSLIQKRYCVLSTQGYKTFFMLKAEHETEHEIYPAHKCFSGTVGILYTLRFCLTLNYTKNKNRKPVAGRHVVGALHDPCTGTARWPHSDGAGNTRF